ncbi:MAG: hypothetical protein WC315_00295 [Candidatus Omnitrophota bacterium]|jgi:hypothetical protein
MPGPVSDAYDPVWGTTDNANEVRRAIKSVREMVSHLIGSDPQYILDVIRYQNNNENLRHVTLSERQLRIIRFCLSVALNEEVV